VWAGKGEGCWLCQHPLLIKAQYTDAV